MKVRYIGPCDGFHGTLMINVKRGKIYEVDDKMAVILIKGGQFGPVETKKKEKKTTQMEVKKHG